MKPPITLNEFVEEQKRQLDLFQAYWLSRQKGDADGLFPDSLFAGDWDEQFNFFKENENA